MKQYRWIKEIGKGILALLSGGVGVMGCYPLLPAFFAVCSTSENAHIWVLAGSFMSIFWLMPISTMIKYLFVLVIIGLGTRIYRWMNHGCNVWEAGIIAGAATIVMNLAEKSFNLQDLNVLLLGISEGMIVLGAAVCMHYLGALPFHLKYRMETREAAPYQVVSMQGRQADRMESLAYAVNGLSDAFMAMSQPKEKLITEEVSVLEQELTGKLCASCDGCAICWNENRMRRQGGIRALLYAVINHSSKEELLQAPYVEDCGRYEGMVEEAIQAFGRLELNHAWYNRLQENRYVIAQQLDAMAGLMEEWAKSRVNVDKRHQKLLSRVAYEVKEKGLLTDNLHVYEDNGRICIEGFVASKWDGGIPVKHYLEAVEKATRTAMRLGKDSKNILTQEGAFVSVYEDTRFYGLQGIATETKNGSPVNGDNVSFFAMDDGNYHICLSDGMGSGNRAKQESEMVVDLLQKFIEAGFRKETAIKLMNSAMVLQGENNIFSTLDYAMIDLYTGKLELIKIGGAATFIKRGQEVECIDEGNLPAGADVRMEVESTKRQLQSGDFLVMVTDGVIEYLHVRNPKEVLSDIIAMAKTDNAGVLAETILEQVLLRTGGYAMDDMTVLVTGIWEK